MVRVTTIVLLACVLTACTDEEDACRELGVAASDARTQQVLLDLVHAQVRSGELKSRHRVLFPPAGSVSPDLVIQALGSHLQARPLTDKGAIGGVLISRRSEYWHGIVVDVRSDRRVPLVLGASPEGAPVGYVCGARD